MTRDMEIKKVALALKNLLETEGFKTTAKSIVNIIRNENLGDLERLKTLVRMSCPSSQKEAIANFILDNWETIKNNRPVRRALENAYCAGRYNKECRNKMIEELMERLEA